MLLCVGHRLLQQFIVIADLCVSDEADVFLESRSNNTANLERNALVSGKESQS